MPRLTAHLLDHHKDAFNAATQHPWLKRAGEGSLPHEELFFWLKQDRLYALNYVSFIGALLAKVSIPTTANRATTLEWRIASLLIDALTNIRRELAMFEDVLRNEFEWSWDDTMAKRETRAYADIFAGAAAPNKSLLEGMTVLWATEKCYLEAWRFAQSQPFSGSGLDVLRKTLIPNWTSDEFVAFVDHIGALLDELASTVRTGGAEWQKCGDAWSQVLYAEKMFWPEVL